MGETEQKPKTIRERAEEFSKTLYTSYEKDAAYQEFIEQMRIFLKEVSDVANEEMYNLGGADARLQEFLHDVFDPLPEPKLKDVECPQCKGVDAHEPGCFYA